MSGPDVSIAIEESKHASQKLLLITVNGQVIVREFLNIKIEKLLVEWLEMTDRNHLELNRTIAQRNDTIRELNYTLAVMRDALQMESVKFEAASSTAKVNAKLADDRGREIERLKSEIEWLQRECSVCKEAGWKPSHFDCNVRVKKETLDEPELEVEEEACESDHPVGVDPNAPTRDADGNLLSAGFLRVHFPDKVKS